MPVSGLKSINAYRAAEADLARRARNQAADAPPYEQYAFHRCHVRAAKDPHDLLKRAARAAQVGVLSAKRNTVLLYGDVELLTAAAQIAPGDS